jgi:hypothetical protein
VEKQEIDDISNTFLEAWREYFGTPIIYMKKKSPIANSSKLYDEKIGKASDYEDIGPIYATIKYLPTEDELTTMGLQQQARAVLRVINKELEDLGVTSIDGADRIKIIDKNDKTVIYKIKESNPRVQFSNSYIFTSIGVDELGH